MEAGILHNQALDYIASQLKAPEVLPADKIVSLVLDWYVTQVPQATPEQKIAFYAATASGMNYTQRYSVEELCTMGKLSGQATGFLTKALAITGEYPSIIEQLNDITQQALKADLAESDRYTTFLTLAIASKSAEYGQLQQELGDKSPWSGYGDRKWPWDKDAHGGVAGAIGGALTGAYAGIAGGIFGIIAGAIGGAIIGGYAGAIGESVAEVLYP